jgi:hypothetical protein
MTPFFWQKRASKKLSATLLFLAVLIIVFLFRHPIAIKSIERFTKPYDVYITCLNFSLDWRLNLNIKQACLTSPLGIVEVSGAMWQPWSNVLNFEHIQIKHIEHVTTHNLIDEGSSNKQQKEKIYLPDSLPTLSIVSLEIESFELLQPLGLSVTTTSNNELSITGDVNVLVKIEQNTLVGNVDWRLSDLIKWVPHAQTFYHDNPQLLKNLAIDNTKIKTSLFFDGVMFKVDNSLGLASRIYVSNCPIDVFLNGNLLVNVDINHLNISVDLSQLSSGVSVEDCPLLKDYFVADDWPKLSFIFPQNVAIDKTQISLPQLKIVDELNTHRSITLSALNYKTTGELEVNYNISVKQPIQTKKMAADMVSFEGSGKIQADFSTLNNQNIQPPMGFKIIDDSHQLIVNNLKIDSLLIGQLTSEFYFQHIAPNQPLLKGSVYNTDIQIGTIDLAKTSSDFSLSGVNFNDLQLSIDNQLSQFALPELSIQNMTNHIDVYIKEWDILSFAGNSTVTNSTVQNINFLPIDITHTGQVSVSNLTLSSQHNISLEQVFWAELEQQQTEIKVNINQQDIIRLQSIISQLESNTKIKEGNFSANIVFSLPQEGEPFIAQGNAGFQGVSVKYQDYIFNDITYQTPLRFDSAGLQLTESILYVDSVDVGVTIEQVEASVIAKDSVLRFTQVQGEIFNGRFSLADLWLDGREQQFNINIQNIDLAQVIALQQQPGIQITGNIDGDLPLIMGTQGISIEDGWVSSLTGGKLTIIDNPSFDSIKVQQPDLALLENLDFSQLESSVKLNPDGWVFFDFSIKGNNPNERRGVNFNYSHQENIFPLLESIRLVKSIENTIEQKITQGDKK